MKLFSRILILAAALLVAARLPAAERIPPVPPRYFNDTAGVVSPAVANALNLQLEQYEKASSNQLLVAIYPKMESDSSVEDYTVRIAEGWKVGQKGRNNGAVLFVFRDDHKLYLQVGYGLEPTLTDAIASQIIEDQLKPAFRAGDYAGGLQTAVNSMIAATKGEFKGTGRTAAQGNHRSTGNSLVTLFIVLLILYSWFSRFRRNVVYAGRRGGGGFWIGGGGGGSGGGFGGGGGGGFSGGGGSFGGGGAGGSW